VLQIAVPLGKWGQIDISTPHFSSAGNSGYEMCLWVSGAVKPLILPTALALAACASAPPPATELASARAAIEQAAPFVSHYAPAELAAAQKKLERAEQALARDDRVQARRLAEEAEVDARFAWALAENERSRQ